MPLDEHLLRVISLHLGIVWHLMMCIRFIIIIIAKRTHLMVHTVNIKQPECQQQCVQIFKFVLFAL